MDDLIRKKIEYLLRILQQAENRNNNLSTLVETAIEVIKLNQEKLKSVKFSNEIKEINVMISEFEKNDIPLTDEQYNNLLITSLNTMKSIEDDKIMKEINKDEYNNVMNELLQLSKYQKDASKETNISKIVETALDIITHNTLISKNKQDISYMEDNFKYIKNKFKEIIKKLIQMNRDRKKDNDKAIVETAIEILRQLKPLPTSQSVFTDDNKNNDKVLLETAIDIVSQPNPLSISQSVFTDDSKNNDKALLETAIDIVSQPKPTPQEKNIQTKLSSIFRRFNSVYISFNKFLTEHKNEVDEKKNIEINELKEYYENQSNIMKKTITELESEIKRYEEKDENSWEFVRKQIENIQKLNNINEEIEKKIKDLENQQLGNENEIQKLNTIIKEREQQIEFGNNRIQFLDDKIKKVTDDNKINIEERNKKIQNLEAEITKNKDANNKLLNNLSNQFEEKKRFKRENESLQEQIGILNIENDNQKELIQELKNEIKNNKEQFEDERKSLTELMVSNIDFISNQAKIFEKQMDEKIKEIKNMKDEEIKEIKNMKDEEKKKKNKQLLNVVKKITYIIPNLQEDINKLDVFFPEIAKMKDFLQVIKSKTDCATSENLIGKIDNECLYFDKDNNKIISKSNDDIIVDALVQENKKLREQYKEKIGVIKALHSSKIEELKNNENDEIEEEGSIPFISG